MKIFHEAKALQAWLGQARAQGHSVGFVPTMGALHEGHLSLLAEAKAENPIAVCSIYVNPTQFDNPADLAKYPRVLNEDVAMLKAAGCDALFAPADAEMYPNGLQVPTKLHFGLLETVMEGAFRKGHFNGVGLVVSKLFHLVQPDRAYFGQKDLQQFAIIQQMVRDFSFPLQLKRCAIVREADGLAMSSRNRRLSAEERAIAKEIYASMQEAVSALKKGASVAHSQAAGKAHLAKFPAFSLEYFEIVETKQLQPIAHFDKEVETAICVAAHLGNVRLIDNCIV